MASLHFHVSSTQISMASLHFHVSSCFTPPRSQTTTASIKLAIHCCCQVHSLAFLPPGKQSTVANMNFLYTVISRRKSNASAHFFMSDRQDFQASSPGLTERSIAYRQKEEKGTSQDFSDDNQIDSTTADKSTRVLLTFWHSALLSLRQLSELLAVTRRGGPNRSDKVVDIIESATQILGLKELMLAAREASSSFLVWCACLGIVVTITAATLESQAFVVSPTKKLQQDELVTVQLFKENTPSVVYITNLASRRDVFTLDVLEVPQGSGSGFVWNQDGYIVTNYHVIRGASDLRVTLGDQSTYEAEVVGYDQDKDVAVLHIDAPKNKLKPIPVGSSSDLLVGQKVYAIGNPFGLDHTLTTGVISGLRREISSAASGRPIQDVIQIDAAINPGNSGGPLLDSSGYLIGINTAIYSPSGGSAGVGFSIPVDTVSGIVEQLIKYGKVTRPILGITFAPEQSVEQLGVSGVLILDAPPDGPAGKAGLKPTTRDSYGRLILGDIISSLNGEKISNGSDLYRFLDRCKVGDTVTVEVLRGDQKLKIPLTLEARD